MVDAVCYILQIKIKHFKHVCFFKNVLIVYSDRMVRVVDVVLMLFVLERNVFPKVGVGQICRKS